MEGTEKDIKYRKAAAWRACSKLTKIWKSSLPKTFKLRLFAATVESVLLYGCETWTVSSKLAKGLDGMYTRMLRTVLNVHWSQHVTNKDLYGQLPKLSDKIRQRRIRFAGHCSRSKHEPVSELIHWIPKHGYRRPGKPNLTFIDTLKQDTGLAASEFQAAMEDRKLWRSITVRERHPP